ncbi:MAG: hypothetical protein NC319_04645 [Butyricicoccus sp.]|nr:hypothetical protein [Butyricicoccus sp.]
MNTTLVRGSIADKIYIALCLAVLILPFAGMLIFGGPKPAANEVLAPRPGLTDDDGGFNAGVLNDTQDYIADRFFLRQECASAWSAINAKLLRTSVEDSVVLGSDGWLYYGETMDDYMGLGLSDGQLAAAARNLALMQEYVQGRGARFVFTIAPNKNSLYPEHMPGWVPAGSGGNRERLDALLDAEGVNYADLFAPFLEQGETLYYRGDSHWTSRGAALAADALLRFTGRGSDWFDAEFFPTDGHIGDLYEMLYPTRTRVEAVESPVFTHTADANPNGGNALNIRTHSSGEGALLCFRDSFGRALYPYLADSFGEALFCRQESYDLTRMDELGADTVIIELVERNIDWLIARPPVFPAPERGVPDAREIGGSVALAFEDENTAGTAGLRRWYGEADADAGAPVYLLCSGRWYECCLLDGENGGSGFSAWLPSDAGTPERVCVCAGGEAVSLPCTKE